MNFSGKSFMEWDMKKIVTSYPWVVAAQYFLFFGGMGIFLPYFNLYCYQIGFNGIQIGMLSAIRSGSTIVFPLLFSLLADRFSLRKPIYITCTFVSSVVWVFFMFTTDYQWMLLIMALYGIFYAPIISLLEAITMDTLGKEKNSYGAVRAWGSLSFILIVVSMGKIIDDNPIRLILLAYFIFAGLQAINSILIPPSRSFRSSTKSFTPHFLLHKKIIIFFFCSFLMLVSHGAYYGFYSIHLEHLGYSNMFIGITWALASIAEIAAMVKSKSIFKRFSLESVLVFSFGVAVFRWVMLYQFSHPVLIILSQILHALTYGTFHMACILYIDRESPEESKNMGQAVNNASSYGLGLMVGFFLNGYLYEHMATNMLFLVSGFIALAGGLLFGGNLWLENSKHSKSGQNGQH